MSKMIVGACLIAAGIGIVGWNETRTASTQDAIAEMSAAAVELGSVNSVNASFDGKTVHASGMLTLERPFVDPDFGVTGDVLSFTRNVQFYIWREKSHTQTVKGADGKDIQQTTYSYVRDWGPDYVDSSSFHDTSVRSSRANRKLADKPREATVYAAKAMLGAYDVPASMLKGLVAAKPYDVVLDENARLKLASLIADRHSGWTRHILGFPLTASTPEVAYEAARRLIHAQGNTLYIGLDPMRPAIGDVRVTYSAVRPAEISLIATTAGNSFKPFVSSKGKELAAVAYGKKSMEELCASEQSGNKNLAWLLRGVGALAALLGIGVIARKKQA